MSTEANAATIRRLAAEFWNTGRPEVFDEVFAPQFVDHTPLPGTAGTKAGFRQAALALQAAFSEAQTTVDDLIAAGDQVAWRWTFRGLHTGPLMGIPATHKPITMTGITIDRLANGQIVERWSQLDQLGLLQQLGAIPAPDA